jgi:cell division protein FtsL
MKKGFVKEFFFTSLEKLLMGTTVVGGLLIAFFYRFVKSKSDTCEQELAKERVDHEIENKKKQILETDIDGLIDLGNKLYSKSTDNKNRPE